MNVSHLPYTALVLSVIIHLMIFNTFIFTFPLNPSAHKPNLIFLGPILKKNDVVQPQGGIKQKQHPVDAAAKNMFSSTPQVSGLMDGKKITTPSPFIETTLKKPLLDIENDPQNKVTLKSTFELSEIKEQGSEQQIEDGEIDFKIAPYHPLRLRRQ